MPSFDIVSEINMQELDNAVNQAKKELLSRYDLKGSEAEVHWDQEKLYIVANDDSKLNVVKDILQSKCHKRGIDLRALEFSDPTAVGGMLKRRDVKIIQGLETEVAKKITKHIRDIKLKVQTQIQDQKIKVTSKSRDELQNCMQDLRGQKFDAPLQFDNFRD